MTSFRSIMIFTPTLLICCCVVARAQSVGLDDKRGDYRTTGGDAAADASKEVAVDAVPETSALEKIKLDPAAALELLQLIDMDAVERGKYVASIELTNPLKPSFSPKGRTGTDSQVLFGLRRPYYRLEETVRVIGSFDLKAAGTVAGLKNSATFTFRYDFRGDLEKRAFRVSMLMEQISYRIIIPFGKPGE